MKIARNAWGSNSPAARFFLCAGIWSCLLLNATFALAASNDVLGEVRLKAVSKVEKTAGIWVDGQYLGYLKELKGSKKILLLPGQHQIVARLSGHRDFETDVDVVAGESSVVRVAMREKLGARRVDKKEMARVKLQVTPSRAAVFVDDRFIGHVDQYDGIGQSLGLPPGTYKIAIELPGYEPFESELTLHKRQRYEIETRLRKGHSIDNSRLSRDKQAIEAERVLAEAD